MSITVEDISGTKKRLKIEIPVDIVQKEYAASVGSVRQRAKIPGFRPGHAPVSIIEKRFGSDIKSDIIDRLVPDYYSKALKEANLVPVTLPKFDSSLEFNKDEPLSFSLTVEVRPDVGELRYTGMKVDEIESSVEDKEIEDTLTGLQDERAMYDVVDRPVRENDLIVIDYVKFDPTGEKELASAKDQVMNLGNNLTPQGILDELVGKKKGDIADITLPAFEGGEVKEGEGGGDRIRVTIKEVKEKKLPEIDDEFAKDFGHDSLDALREKIKQGILTAKKDNAAKQQKAKLLDLLVENHEMEVPESLLERELENLVVNEKASQKKSGGLTSEAEQEKSAASGDDTEILERLRPKAIKNVKATMLLDMIAEKEGVTVTEDEIKSRIAILARHFQTTPENVINLFVTKDGSLENFKHTIQDEKVMELVLSKADVVKGA
ncbi:MAG: trigger factor [Nitrospirota bacterium]|nr:trigger factor [Nitrospirota bacterium]